MALRAATLLAVSRAAAGVVWPFEVMSCSAGEPVLTTKSMTTCEYNDAVQTITGMWASLSTTCTAEECQQASWAGCVLRVAGHDFMDYDPSVVGRGADGCTDLDAGDNKGLRPCMVDGLFGKSLKDAYQKVCTKVSLADFLVISAEAVMMATRAKVPGVEALDFATTFKFGRTTSKECPGAGGSLPNPEGGCGEVDRVFVKNMGLDWRGAAALMGVHTLGSAHTNNSGYDGSWLDPENSRQFNNAYYQSMVANGWMAEDAVGGNPAKNQWRRTDGKKPGPGAAKQMMLNTDLCLAYDNPAKGFALDAKNNTGCCAWSVATATAGMRAEYCGASNTPHDLAMQHKLCCDGQLAPDCGDPTGKGGRAFDEVKEFASNDTAWVLAFRGAWAKATENGFPSLTALQPCPGAAPPVSGPTPAPPESTLYP